MFERLLKLIPLKLKCVSSDKGFSIKHNFAFYQFYCLKFKLFNPLFFGISFMYRNEFRIEFRISEFRNRVCRLDKLIEKNYQNY